MTFTTSTTLLPSQLLVIPPSRRLQAWFLTRRMLLSGLRTVSQLVRLALLKLTRRVSWSPVTSPSRKIYPRRLCTLLRYSPPMLRVNPRARYFWRILSWQTRPSFVTKTPRAQPRKRILKRSLLLTTRILTRSKKNRKVQPSSSRIPLLLRNLG